VLTDIFFFLQVGIVILIIIEILTTQVVMELNFLSNFLFCIPKKLIVIFDKIHATLMLNPSTLIAHEGMLSTAPSTLDSHVLCIFQAIVALITTREEGKKREYYSL